MDLSDKYKTMGVRTNADTPKDAKAGCRVRRTGHRPFAVTEHMFFDPQRIGAFREMICSETLKSARLLWPKLSRCQQADFGRSVRSSGRPTRSPSFLDPPLHGVCSDRRSRHCRLSPRLRAKRLLISKQVISDLHEFQPMMGHRGCRLTVTYPEIAAMQTKAIIKAALAVKARHADWNIVPEIMIPLVGEIKEFKFVKDIVVKTADAEIKAAGSDLKYEVGTMIEIPRAALTADEIAKEADSSASGTNDLTR